MAIEYEFKYKADENTLAHVSLAFPEKAEIIQMETAYFDTPSGAYAQRHYTLRRRKENDKYICTLKTPAAEAKKEWEAEVSQKYSHPTAPDFMTGSTRNEWEVECEHIEDAFSLLVEKGAPKEVWKLAATEGLKCICGAKFTRIARIVKLRDSVVELDMDYGFLFGGDKSEPFYELEFEIKSGDKVEAGNFIYKTACQYDLETETRSKFARALQLYKGE